MTQGRGTLGHMSRIFGGMTGNRHRGVAGRAQQVDKMRDFGSMRVDKLLSTFGLATRSRSKQFLKEIGVSLLSDPEKFLTGATRVNPQEVLIGGEPLLIPRPLHIMLNKPVDYICSHEEEPSIYSLIPAEFTWRLPKLASAGRLDRMSSGLLILSQSGPLIHRLISPKHHCERQYRVEVDTPLDIDSQAEKIAFEQGSIAIRDRKTNELVKCMPARLEYIDSTTARVWLNEGRYHQLRRMFQTLGKTVVGIHRESMGVVSLDPNLAPGEWRELSEDELRQLT